MTKKKTQSLIIASSLGDTSDYNGKLSDTRLEELKEYWAKFVPPGLETKPQAENMDSNRKQDAVPF